jgi:hypothetical protein
MERPVDTESYFTEVWRLLSVVSKLQFSKLQFSNINCI